MVSLPHAARTSLPALVVAIGCLLQGCRRTEPELPTPGFMLAASCNDNCNEGGEDHSCRSRIDWLQTSAGGSLDHKKAREKVNKECSGQCSCEPPSPCEDTCNVNGDGDYTCKARVDFKMSSDGGSLDTGAAMEFVNAECDGQCSCTWADFPTPAPTAPTPVPTPYPPGMKPPRTEHYFILLGDWGSTEWTRSNSGGKAGDAQRRVANRMREYVKGQSKKLAFICALGDNFYGGMDGNGNVWQSSWKDYYHELTDVTWYATLGNHDFNHADKVLGHGGGQANQLGGGGEGKSIRANYYIPDHNYYKEIPELNIEVISVDQNHEAGGYIQDGSTSWNHLERVRREGEDLIRQRARVSRDDTTYMLIQHYPGRNDHVRKIWGDSGGKGKLISAFGHDHNCNDLGGDWGASILSGGGGGYGGSYCFVVVHLNEDTSVHLETIRV